MALIDAVHEKVSLELPTSTFSGAIRIGNMGFRAVGEHQRYRTKNGDIGDC